MFGNRLYLSIVSSHFVVDMLNGMCGVLLAVLSGPLELSNAQIAMAITLYTLIAALSQPLFGWWTDGLPERGSKAGTVPLLLGSVGVVWLAFFFCVVAFSPTWGLLLPFFLLAALGSGLFHPIGTAYATTVYAGSANTATALFFLWGQMGLALGPMLGGVLFASAGKVGIVPMAAMAMVPAGMLWQASRQWEPPCQAGRQGSVQDEGPDWRAIVGRLATLVVLAFLALVVLRSSIQTIYQFLLPKLFADRGWEPTLYGLLAGIFMGTAAVGNVLVGKLADRFGARLVTSLSLLASVPVGLFFLMTPSVGLIFLTCGLAGLLTGGQHSVLVVHAQQLLPVRKGFAAGLILGFTFAAGALGTWLCGIAADVYGLEQAMRVVMWLGLPSGLLALTLPGRAAAVHE